MARKMQAVLVKPKSPMTVDYPGSDTLFGAICWAIRLIEGEGKLREILDRFSVRDPPFLLSSAFPCNKLDGEYRYLLPMPICLPPHIPSGTSNRSLLRKWAKLKEVRWADITFLKEFLNGKFSVMEILKGMEETKSNVAGIRPSAPKAKVKRRYIFDRFEFQGVCLASWSVSLSREIEITGNRVNRLTNSTDEYLHFYSAYHFGPEDYFYFLIDCESEVEETLRAALHFLEDRGIGGNISSGKGHVGIKIRPFENIGASSGQFFVNLSTYCPTHEELEFYSRSKRLAYSLVYRQGVMESSFIHTAHPWKKGVLSFQEGSIFPVIDDRRYYGENPIVYDECFQVQQYGFSMPLKGVFELEA